MLLAEVTSYTPYQLEFEALDQGVQRGWAMERQIVVFIVPSLHQEALDIWAANVIQTAAGWPAEKPILIMHDLRAFGTFATVTPYIHKKSEEIVAAAPEIRGRSVVLIPNTVFLRGISLFLNYLNRHGQPNMQIRVFTELPQAWNWLTAGLPEA